MNSSLRQHVSTYIAQSWERANLPLFERAFGLDTPTERTVR
jgi:hypothetical protein